MIFVAPTVDKILGPNLEIGSATGKITKIVKVTPQWRGSTLQ